MATVLGVVSDAQLTGFRVSSAGASGATVHQGTVTTSAEVGQFFDHGDLDVSVFQGVRQAGVYDGSGVRKPFEIGS